jgi:methylenetetrahydrofolate reductase (NADPH)
MNSPDDPMMRRTGLLGGLRRSRSAGEAAVPTEIRQRLVESMRYELVPLKNLEAQIPLLPARSPVSITCSPAKGIDATLELTARLLDLGHDAVPHLAARLFEGPDHVRRLASWCREHGQAELFLVAGDEAEPVGPYASVAALLRDLLATDHGLTRIGITAYPDGHALIERGVLHDALHEKQALLTAAGLGGWASTQMCFNPQQITSWLQTERTAGLTLPVHLGIPGVVDRAKLLSMGMRLGVGASLRYVQKNRKAIGQLLASTGYDPSALVDPLSRSATTLGIEALHVFTFNNIEATAAWQRAQLPSS